MVDDITPLEGVFLTLVKKGSYTIARGVRKLTICASYLSVNYYLSIYQKVNHVGVPPLIRQWADDPFLANGTQGQSAEGASGKGFFNPKRKQQKQARTDTSMQCPLLLWMLSDNCDVELQPLGTMKRGDTSASKWKGNELQALVIILPVKPSCLLSVLSCLLLVKLFISAAWSKML